MFTNILLTMGLLMVAVGPPDFSKMPVLNQSGGFCPNGATIVITNYDANPDDPDAVIRVLESNGVPIAVIDFKKNEVYVYLEKKMYTLEEIQQLYPSPCDIPMGTGI